VARPETKALARPHRFPVSRYSTSRSVVVLPWGGHSGRAGSVWHHGRSVHDDCP